MVGAGRDVLFPSPFVLKGDQLIDICLAVNDAFVGNIDARSLGGWLNQA